MPDFKANVYGTNSLPSTKSTKKPPRWVWIVTWIGVILVTLITACGALLIGLGLTDPLTAGPVIWSDHTLGWGGGRVLVMEPNTGVWFSSPAAADLPESFTVSVRARIKADSDPSLAWGVWVATTDGSRVVYAISGEGYVTTRLCPPDDFPRVEIENCPAVRPEWRWMPYPQIRALGEINSITLHRETSKDVRLRINDERMGIAPVPVSGAWGVWVRGGRESRAVLEWIEAEVAGR
jgi:hypothetical protein